MAATPGTTRWHGATEQDLIEAAQKWARNHKGESPKVNDWSKTNDPNYPPSWRPIKHFGSWNGFLTKAGLAIRTNSLPKGGGKKRIGYWKRDSILRAMKRWHEETGAWPGYRDWQEADKNSRRRPTSGVVMSRFSECKKFAEVVSLASGEQTVIDGTNVIPEGFIGTAEAASILRIEKRSVRRVMVNDKLGEVFTHPDGRFFVSRDAVLAYKARVDAYKGVRGQKTVIALKEIDPVEVPNRAITERVEDAALLALQQVRSMDRLSESVRDLTRVIQEAKAEEKDGGFFRRFFVPKD